MMSSIQILRKTYIDRGALIVCWDPMHNNTGDPLVSIIIIVNTYNYLMPINIFYRFFFCCHFKMNICNSASEWRQVGHPEGPWLAKQPVSKVQVGSWYRRLNFKRIEAQNTGSVLHTCYHIYTDKKWQRIPKAYAKISLFICVTQSAQKNSR